MKSNDDLYDAIASFENLHRAYLKARRGKRYSADCLQFSARLEENLLTLREELVSEAYRTGPYKHFMVYEPKPREIAALPFRDRVVHHALCNVIEPLFEPRFYAHSYACRVGKGTHRAVDYFQRRWRRLARGGPVWVLKGDIQKCFASLRHDILLALLGRVIRCKRTLALLRGIVESAGTVDPDRGARRGVPIGNLTSQFFANVYLTPLDEFVLHVLHPLGYVRYMDDWCLLGRERSVLQEAKARLGEFLWQRLSLRLHTKSQVFPAAQGVNFLGYRIWTTHRLLRKASVTRMRRKLRWLRREYAAGRTNWPAVNARVQSWLGHARHANTYRLRQKLFGEFVLRGERSGRPSKGQPAKPGDSCRSTGGEAERVSINESDAACPSHPTHARAP